MIIIADGKIRAKVHGFMFVCAHVVVPLEMCCFWMRARWHNAMWRCVCVCCVCSSGICPSLHPCIIFCVHFFLTVAPLSSSGPEERSTVLFYGPS